MFYGNGKFRWLSGSMFRVFNQFLTTDLALSEADADSATAVLDRGLMVNIDVVNSKMNLTTGKAAGLLMQKVSLSGLTNVQSFFDLSIGKMDLPTVRRGQPAAIMIPDVFSLCEFEGLGAAAIGNSVITATTTGFLSTNTAVDTELSVIKGGFRIAQAGEQVIAKLKAPNLTAETSGNRRICVQFISPYLKA